MDAARSSDDRLAALGSKGIAAWLQVVAYEATFGMHAQLSHWLRQIRTPA